MRVSALARDRTSTKPGCRAPDRQSNLPSRERHTEISRSLIEQINNKSLNIFILKVKFNCLNNLYFINCSSHENWGLNPTATAPGTLAATSRSVARPSVSKRRPSAAVLDGRAGHLNVRPSKPVQFAARSSRCSRPGVASDRNSRLRGESERAAWASAAFEQTPPRATAGGMTCGLGLFGDDRNSMPRGEITKLPVCADV